MTSIANDLCINELSRSALTVSSCAVQSNLTRVKSQVLYQSYKTCPGRRRDLCHGSVNVIFIYIGLIGNNISSCSE